ncbi:hypothetical protein [Xanthomonas nasturtii]|uniref:hypothetical protein n=1 Tax=Xanthomonas nasturtii TaxID=1843581 RepID=UPI002B234314|nr:hypothetical protein [Xanthomonas nasturtii]
MISPLCYYSEQLAADATVRAAGCALISGVFLDFLQLHQRSNACFAMTMATF